MRTAFIRTLIELARNDKRIFLLVGDLGYGVVEPFAQEFPDRFINVGVAEQNLTGIAAGLALSGKIVFTYSIANFSTLRCLEQIRNDVCYHNADVKIVAVGGGVAYGALGVTHHGTEDIAILRALPNMKVLCPADPVEAELATRAIAAAPGPAYLRLGKSGEPRIYRTPPVFEIGKAIEILPGKEVVVLATGSVVRNAIEACQNVAENGIEVGIYSVHTIKPLDQELIAKLAFQTRLMITVEEHSHLGGLGSAVAEIFTEVPNLRCQLKRIGLPDAFFQEVGSQEFLLSRYLSAAALEESIMESCSLGKGTSLGASAIGS
ncbi:MAG TPA: transketolase C-terminal domain-containing protein [Candidatus Acidoferrales bacterium]